jgi:hypothetical protein
MLTTKFIIFDCKAEYEKWEDHWSNDKKKWCCSHEHRGCSIKGVATTTTKIQLDCKAGVNNWKDGWSKFKRDWCCKTQGFPCKQEDGTKNSTSTVAEMSPSGNDSHTNDTETSKQDETKISDINDNETSKKENETKNADGHDQKPYDCSLGLPSTATGEQHNCTEGIMDWRRKWSVAKREWCCTQKLLWCPTDSVKNLTREDSSSATPVVWSKHKRDWCCKHEQKGCDNMDELRRLVLEEKAEQRQPQHPERVRRADAMRKTWTAAFAWPSAAAGGLALVVAGLAVGRARRRNERGLVLLGEAEE